MRFTKELIVKLALSGYGSIEPTGGWRMEDV